MEVNSKASINTTDPAKPESVPSDYKIKGTYHVTQAVRKKTEGLFNHLVLVIIRLPNKPK